MIEGVGPVNGNSALQVELLNALIGKVVDQGASLKEMADQTRKIAGSQEAVKDLHERMAAQEKGVEGLMQSVQVLIDETKQVAGKIDLPSEKIEALQQALIHFGRQFEKPLDKTVHYHHYVGKAVWVLAVMTLITVGAMTMAVWQWNRAGEYAGDAVKWRYVALSVDPTVDSVVQRAQFWGRNDPAQLARDVEREEQRRAEVAKNEMREKTARRKIEELQQQKELR